MRRVLIIEDEKDISDLISFNLKHAGYEVLCAYDGINGSEMALNDCPDAIVLDVMLPGRSGNEVIKDIRNHIKTRDIPVIMLSGLIEAHSRISGLENGADDYMTKPFSPKELLLRVSALLKRQGHSCEDRAVIGPFCFDFKYRQFFLERKPIDLTATEFRLLFYLTERIGETQKRENLLAEIWGYSDEVMSRTLDTHVRRLRRKLGGYASMVETVNGVGYKVRAA